MVRRVLNTIIDSESNFHRHNIFHIRCTIKDKVCKLIINGGSCENVISSQAVDKLELSSQSHLTSYKLAWLNKCDEIKVITYCLVQFLNGNKLHEAWCDVVFMDTCHILLGRP